MAKHHLVAVKTVGTDGSDVLYAQWNTASTVEGGAGDDTLVAFAGGDTLTGGPGSDTFVFGNWSFSHAKTIDWAGLGVATITDFEAIDKIDLSAVYHLDVVDDPNSNRPLNMGDI